VQQANKEKNGAKFKKNMALHQCDLSYARR